MAGSARGLADLAPPITVQMPWAALSRAVILHGPVDAIKKWEQCLYWPALSCATGQIGGRVFDAAQRSRNRIRWEKPYRVCGKLGHFA